MLPLRIPRGGCKARRLFYVTNADTRRVRAASGRLGLRKNRITMQEIFLIGIAKRVAASGKQPKLGAPTRTEIRGGSVLALQARERKNFCKALCAHGPCAICLEFRASRGALLTCVTKAFGRIRVRTGLAQFQQKKYKKQEQHS